MHRAYPTPPTYSPAVEHIYSQASLVCAPTPICPQSPGMVTEYTMLAHGKTPVKEVLTCAYVDYGHCLIGVVGGLPGQRQFLGCQLNMDVGEAPEMSGGYFLPEGPIVDPDRHQIHLRGVGRTGYVVLVPDSIGGERVLIYRMDLSLQEWGLVTSVGPTNTCTEDARVFVATLGTGLILCTQAETWCFDTNTEVWCRWPHPYWGHAFTARDKWVVVDGVLHVFYNDLEDGTLQHCTLSQTGFWHLDPPPALPPSLFGNGGEGEAWRPGAPNPQTGIDRHVACVGSPDILLDMAWVEPVVKGREVAFVEVFIRPQEDSIRMTRPVVTYDTVSGEYRVPSQEWWRDAPPVTTYCPEENEPGRMGGGTIMTGIWESPVQYARCAAVCRVVRDGE
ncbi:hypothetical protein KIPB_009908 [Kipferlia bialata]|uniref:Uncharacterized protein n=1 Tax=Kipferlia bialata TaxID=797122 RepID=A0A9K3D2Z2_9EUKA|nr:hypothetical protein KIPB_009908 [Kipferlia bialata]|eukprot:g9908.t1